eukprot:Opistho-2@72879
MLLLNEGYSRVKVKHFLRAYDDEFEFQNGYVYAKELEFADAFNDLCKALYPSSLEGEGVLMAGVSAELKPRSNSHIQKNGRLLRFVRAHSAFMTAWDAKGGHKYCGLTVKGRKYAEKVIARERIAKSHLSKQMTAAPDHTKSSEDTTTPLLVADNTPLSPPVADDTPYPPASCGRHTALSASCRRDANPPASCGRHTALSSSCRRHAIPPC